MNKRIPLLVGLAAMLAAAVACQGLFSGQGTLRISFLNSPTFSTRAGINVPDTEDFILSVSDAKGNLIYSGRFGDSPEEFTLSSGSYTVTAISEEFYDPAFDTPQLGDSKVVVVNNGELSEVILCCRQLNSGIKLNVDDSFVSTFPEGTMHIDGLEGVLEYGYDETRTAYFRPGTVSVYVSESGLEQILLTRTLEEQQILSVNISASVSGSSGGISISVDTTRTYLVDDYVYGGGKDGSTVETAYDIMEARERSGEEDVWVCGYIVGVATSTGKISFEPPFTKETNIALGLRATTDNTDYCLTVELKAGAIREGLNLLSNPDILGRQVYIRGDLVSAYYGIPGLKNLSEYQFK